MKNIEIKTAQNVILQYELADLRDRVVAFLIDFAILIFGIAMLIAVFSGIVSEGGIALLMTMLSCIFIFYSLAFEVFNRGQSPGKMAMRIQVIKAVGGHATFADYAARWVFRMVDIYFSLGGIASVLIASSSHAQRIGDIVANTVVVKRTPKIDLKLQDLLTIHEQGSYKPEYVQAKQLMEEDVLLIKSTLDRYQRFYNEAHQEALDLLAGKIAEELHLEKNQPDNKRFLQTVLKDYVVLTR
jgi:uncharacterized RDD family membrane protein YckC